jgi:hypothetical protein
MHVAQRTGTTMANARPVTLDARWRVVDEATVVCLG